MTAQFLLGAGGKLVLANGKPLVFTPGQGPNTGIRLVPFLLNTTQAADANFNISTTASSNDTLGDVPFPFTYDGGAPQSVYARVLASDGVTEVITWTDITPSVSIVNGVGLGYLNGVPAGVGYKRQVRVGTAGSTSLVDTNPFNIGPMILAWGQSNMSKTLYGGFSYGSAVPGTAYTEQTWYDKEATVSFFGKIGWVGVSNMKLVGDFVIDGWGGVLYLTRILTNQLKSKFGRKVGVGMNPWSQNATPFAGFLDTANNSTMIDNAGSTNGTLGFSSPPQSGAIGKGDYRVVAWHQGETTDSDESPMNRTQRFNKLIRLCQKHINHVALYGRRADQLTFLFAFMGTGTPNQMEVLRGSVLDLVEYGKKQTPAWDVRIGWNCIDCTPLNSDGSLGLHMDNNGATHSVRRLTQAFMNVLDPANVPHGAIGPSIQGTKLVVDSVSANNVNVITGNATRAPGSDVVTITVTHDGGSTLVAKTPGSPITGWYANTAPDFSGTDIALTNVTILPPNQIQVTATGAPATFYIKHCGGKLYTLHSYGPDITNLIYDDFAYPSFKIGGVEQVAAGDQFTGLPLLPTPDAIKVG